MSTIFLHVGQCGNQLGESFWQEVAGWYSPTSRPPRAGGPVPSTSKYSSFKKETHHTKSLAHLLTPYSLLDGTIPSILVDTEPKVIRQCTGEGSVLGKGVPSQFRVAERRGRGSNWAYGYCAATKHRIEDGKRTGAFLSGLCEEKRLVDTVQEHIRTLVEKCDRFGGFVQLHSIAGGTGSGVGSAIIEQLREEYPLSYILSTSVAPFSYGETPLQYYNSLLCLKTLQMYADGVLLFQNDHVLTQAEKCRSRSSSAVHDGRLGSAGNAAVQDMNGHISQTLCNALLPIWSAKQKLPPLSGPEPWELIRSLCPDPSLKFIFPMHTHLTKSTDTWDSAFSSITTSMRSAISSRLPGEHESLPGSAPTKPPTTALVVICRASPTATEFFMSGVSTIEKRLKQTYNTVSWNPFPVDVWCSYEPQLRERKVVSVLANSAVVGGYLESVVEKAQQMYQEKAYLHWFEKYGCERDTFEEAFQTVQGIMDSYRSL